MKIKAVSFLFIMFVAGCGTTPAESGTAATESVQTAEQPEKTNNTQTPTRSPEPSPTPDRQVIDTWSVGELISMPSADITVETLEQRDSIEKSSNFDDGNYQYMPREGERLWYIDIEWTNNSSEVVSKECHGPYSVQIHAFDVNGNEMMMVDQPGTITGQECSTGLMTGQTGRWQTAFRSLDADFGWIAFDDYEGALEFVTLDPNLELSFDPSS